MEIDRMFGHGGVFRTAGVAQRFLAGALNAPFAVGDTSAKGGPWGIAVHAAYLAHAGTHLSTYLTDDVSAGLARYLTRYHDGLAAERAAADVR